MLAAGFETSLLHPLSTGGGTLYGGIIGDLGEVTLVTALIGSAWMAYRHHNCHVDGCWRIGHIDPAVHHPACKHHHSHRHLIGRDPNPERETVAVARADRPPGPTPPAYMSAGRIGVHVAARR